MKFNKQKLEQLKEKIGNIKAKMMQDKKERVPKKYYGLLILMLLIGIITLSNNMKEYSKSRKENYREYIIQKNELDTKNITIEKLSEENKNFRNNEDRLLVNNPDLLGEKIATKTLLLRIIFYSLPITINSGIQYGGNMIDTAVLKGRLIYAGFAEESASALHGMLGATRQLLNVPNALVSSLCISLLPVIAGLYAQKKYGETEDKANYAFKLCFTLAVPMSVALCVFAEPLYVILGLGNGYKLLSYMSFSVLLLAIVHLQSSVMQSVNQLIKSTVFMGIGVLVKLLLNYVLVAIPWMNVYGAIIATYISYIIPLLLNHIFLKKDRNINIKIHKLVIIPLLSSGVMIVFASLIYFGSDYLIGKVFGTYVTSLISLLFAAVVGVVVYFLTMYKLHGINEEDVSLVLPKRITGKLFKKEE